MAVLTSNTMSSGVLSLDRVLGTHNDYMNNYMTDNQIRELKRSIDEQRYLYDKMNKEVIQPKSTPNKLLLLCEV